MQKVLKVLPQGFSADPFPGVPPRQNRGRGCQKSVLFARQLLSNVYTTATGGFEMIHRFCSLAWQRPPMVGVKIT